MPRNPAADVHGRPLVVATGEGELLPFVTPGDWHGTFAPERSWRIDQWIPDGRATLLSGDGGSGKSLVAQQMATCVAIGAPFMGIEIERARSMYVTCEDDPAELHRRQDGINRALNTDHGLVGGELLLVSRVGEVDNALMRFQDESTPELTKFYWQVIATARANAARFLVLDNVAHMFGGNENVRLHVAAFCNGLEAMAREIEGAVLFLAHPAKSGAQFSGSTAWENQVRSRLFMQRPKADEGLANPDVRTLTRSKSNYAATGAVIEMRWQDWGFVASTADREDWREAMANNAQANAENDRFVELLRIRTGQGLRVSAKRQAPNYAPRVFEAMPSAKRMKADQFQRAMERLLELGTIREVRVRDASRHPVECLMHESDVRDSCGEVPPKKANQQESLGNLPQSGCGTVDAGQSAVWSDSACDPQSESGGNAGSQRAGQLRSGSGVEATGEPAPDYIYNQGQALRPATTPQQQGEPMPGWDD
jgi:RecA-family ATPase